MIGKTISYTNYEGEEVKEVFWFHLSKAELAEMNMVHGEGFDEYLKKIIKSDNRQVILDTFKTLLARSVGKRSADGKHFMKTPEIRADFMNTEAYSELFIELVTDANKASEFVNGIMPAGIGEKINTGTPVSVDLPQTPQPVPNLQVVPEPAKELSTHEMLMAMTPDEFAEWKKSVANLNPLGL